MISVIVKQGGIDEIVTWEGPGQPVIPHTCGNTSNTLVQAYLYAVAKMRGGPVALGTDFNGFAGLPGPRFGPEASPGGRSGPPPDNDGGMGLNVDVTDAGGTRVTGWIGIEKSISREGIAVGLTALTGGRRISVRMDPKQRVATAVRVHV